MTYQLTRDFYIVWVDDIWESKKTKSGIITTNTALHSKNNAKDEVEDRGEFKRRYGIVQEVPAVFSSEMVEMIAPLNPQPRRYVDHEHIQRMHNSQARGYRDIRIRLVNGSEYHEDPRAHYYPSTFDKYEVIGKDKFARGNDINKGDVVYFDHTCTDVEHYLGAYKQGHLFAMSVENIMCVQREIQVFKGHKLKQKRIFPQSKWVFVRLDMEDWKDVVNELGLQVKMAPENKPLQGTVVAAQNKELEGKTVLFERDADAPITVDNRELTVMRESDILATLKS